MSSFEAACVGAALAILAATVSIIGEQSHRIAMPENVQAVKTPPVEPVRLAIKDTGTSIERTSLRDATPTIQRGGTTASSAPVDLERLEAPKLGTRARALQRAPLVAADPTPRSKIVLIVDDLGLDDAALKRVMDLPGPLTLSFLPYGRRLQDSVDQAKRDGHGVMLHLPMEPQGAVDPGPNALWASLSSADLGKLVDWNLARFDGFIGVNNHMGSLFTEDRRATMAAMTALSGKISYFVDSVTTPRTIAEETARSVGIPAYRRDVFLDPEPGTAPVFEALTRLEDIARREGVAIGIMHPRDDTLKVVGAWLTTAPARGFDLVTMDELHATQSTQRFASAR